MAKVSRIHRVGERIQALVANQLIRLSDPRFFLVTISSVVVSRDLRHAKVYWVATGGKERVPEVEEAFRSASGVIRAGMAKELGMRSAPQLRFFYDDTLDTQQEVFELCSRIEDEGEDEETVLENEGEE